MLATDREVKYAKPRGNRAEYRIKGALGLVLRVSAADTKTWTFLYKSPISHKHRKLALGLYPTLSLYAAKDLAQRHAISVHDGHDPRTDQSVDTFAALAARYMAEHLLKNARSGKPSGWTAETQRLLDRDILPAIGQHKAEAITRQQIANVVEAVAERGSYAIANKVLGVVRAIYRWATATGRLEVEPTRTLQKRNVGRPRNRILSDLELRSFWRDLTASGISQEIGDILRLQLLLGLRVGEVAGAAKSEIDLVEGLWVIPASRTKSQREHCLPLPSVAASILKSAMERAGESPWLFPSDKNDGPIKPKSAMRATLRLQKVQARPRICAAFESWCRQHSRPANPTTPEVISGWLKSLSTGNDGARVSRAEVKEHVAVVLADQRAAGNRINPRHPAIAAAVAAAPERRPDMGADRPGYSTHDLRRTFATGLGNLGISDEVIERLLNHAPRTVTGRHYNHAKYFEPMREALEAWERHVLSIVEGSQPSSNQIPIHPEGE